MFADRLKSCFRARKKIPSPIPPFRAKSCMDSYNFFEKNFLWGDEPLSRLAATQTNASHWTPQSPCGDTNQCSALDPSVALRRHKPMLRIGPLSRLAATQTNASHWTPQSPCGDSPQSRAKRSFSGRALGKEVRLFPCQGRP